MIRMALIGVGGIGQTHAEALSRIPDVEIAAVVDRDAEKADRVAGTYGAKTYGDLAECLNEVDAVGIYTPPSTHRSISCLAMENGKHVICEKPLTITVDDAEAIKACAESSDVVFMTAFNMRFREGYGLLHKALEEGRLGSPINYFVQRMGLGVGSYDGWQGYNWRTDPELMCGMTTESLSHDIDMIRWHLGDIKDVYAVTQYSVKGLPGFDDNAYIVMRTACGASVSIQATWSSYIPRNMRGIVGEKGTAIISGPGIWDSDEFSIRTSDMETVSVSEVENDSLNSRSYYEENLHFIDCIKSGDKPGTGAEEGLYALRVSRAILESAKSGEVVRL